ncbi:hypothetical protein EV356DRAFT_534367 [Viridothelium virens]|uniref:Saccharopine dehydrogenase NADP binding domain-containing protein n=1 Tax=Viridothelium virens TaxID=1048519 RepID=A0A6A6H401_VIRVR|nr:hypothetical protein EV356DRAFT_534367 [Viridothelium virens]
MASSSRQYDVIVFGATGYTGKYTVEHITTNLPTDLKWAVAGRSASKLSDLVQDLKKLNPDRIEPDVEVAQLTKDDLYALARKTRLLISTVGPYHLYGTHVVEACAATGTHYLDVTGESPWVYDIVRQYNDLAKSNGAIIIPQIGIESAPADMLAWLLVTHLRRTASLPTAEVVFSIMKVIGTPSGGTFATLMSVMDFYPISHIVKSSKPYAISPIAPPKSSKAKPSLWSRLVRSLTGIRSVSELGTLTTSINGASDRTIVYRSWGLIGSGSFYGPNFRFSPYVRAGNFVRAILLHWGFTLGALALLLKPARWLMKKLVYAPGQGPTKEETARDLFICKALGTADSSATQRPRAVATLKWTGSFYHLTGVFLAEAALVLLRSDTLAHKLGGGVLTPATLGQPFLDNLNKAGLQLDVETLERGDRSLPKL